MTRIIILLAWLSLCSVSHAADMRPLSTLCPDFDTVIYGQVLESRFLCEKRGCQVSIYSIKPYSKDASNSVITVATPARLHTGDYVVAFVEKHVSGTTHVLADDAKNYYDAPKQMDYTASHDSVFIYESNRYYREIDLVDTVTFDSLRQENCPIASCEAGNPFLIESNFSEDLKVCGSINKIGGW